MQFMRGIASITLLQASTHNLSIKLDVTSSRDACVRVCMTGIFSSVPTRFSRLTTDKLILCRAWACIKEVALML